MVLYFVGWVGSWELSTLMQIEDQISLWYPPAAFTFGFLLFFGWRWAWLPLVAALAKAFLIPFEPLRAAVYLVFAVIHVSLYGAMAEFVGPRRFGRIPWLREDAIRFLVGGAVAALAVAALSTLSLVATGLISYSASPRILVTWWLGDLVGIVTLGPAFLAYVLPRAQRYLDDTPTQPATSPSAPVSKHLLLQVFSLVLVFGFLFIWREGPYESLDWTLLIMLPLIWVALDQPFHVACFYIALAGCLLSLLLSWLQPDGNLYAVQSLMIVAAAVSLILSATVSDLRSTLKKAKSSQLALEKEIEKRREVELKARRKERAFNRLSKAVALQQLGSTLAHEINQPVTVIRSLAQRIEKLQLSDPSEPTASQWREWMRAIIGNTGRIAEILSRFRRAHGAWDHSSEAVEVNSQVNSTLASLKPLIELNEVTLKTNLAPGLPRAHVDGFSLDQVLSNLIVNALEALESRPADYRRLTVQTLLSDNEWIAIVVEDSGFGIGKELQQEIFEPFHSMKSHGSGLGLAIVRSVVEGMGGRVLLRSKPGRGTRFTVLVPVAEPASVDQLDQGAA